MSFDNEIYTAMLAYKAIHENKIQDIENAGVRILVQEYMRRAEKLDPSKRDQNKLACNLIKYHLRDIKDEIVEFLESIAYDKYK